MTGWEIVIAILASDVVVAIVTAIISRKRYKAEVKGMDLTNLGTGTNVLKEQIDYLSERLGIVSNELVDMSKQLITKMGEVESLNEKILDMRESLHVIMPKTCSVENCINRKIIELNNEQE